MLVLTRKPDQQIQIGSNIKITVVRVKGQSVRIGIEAPTTVRVVRTELMHNQPEAHTQSVESDTAPLEAATVSSRPSTLKSTAATPTGQVGESDDEQRRNPVAPQHSRIPGVSHTSMVRRPQRLGPVVLRSMAGRF